jgi:hypothetical protein
MYELPTPVTMPVVVMVATAGDRTAIPPLNILNMEKEGEYTLEYITWTLLGRDEGRGALVLYSIVHICTADCFKQNTVLV